jgi:tRNA threonylcarbamoyladenosine biosynthesis protein TsaE
MRMINIATDSDMKALGKKLGEQLRGGEVLELIGDVGTGKTTLAKGVAMGLEVDEDVQSPSFTISRTYEARDSLSLEHYDFYRLQEPGVMSYELAESAADPKAIVLVEWAETVTSVLPEDRIVIRISYHSDDDGRSVDVSLPAKYNYVEIG